jgi:hypothetical protein
MHRNAFKSGDLIAVFPKLALMNHSCAPNSVVTIGYEAGHSGSVLVASVRALRAIATNEEVTISYYPLGINPTEIRQAAIYSKHDFLCGCGACSLDESSADRDLLEQHETHFGDVELTLDPLIVVFESLEEELAAVSSTTEECLATLPCSTCANTSNCHSDQAATTDIEEDTEEATAEDKYDDMNFLLMRAEAGIKNLKLGGLHYLSLKYLVLSAECALLQHKKSDVVRHSQEWLLAMNNASSDIQLLCDAHLRCRMLVILAECLADLFEAPEAPALGRTTKSRNKVLDALTRAIDQASIIYGNDYALCCVLVRRKEEIGEAVTVDRHET